VSQPSLRAPVSLGSPTEQRPKEHHR
jgi:hypothetical protein